MAKNFIETIAHGRTQIDASWWEIVNGVEEVRVLASTLLIELLLSWKEVPFPHLLASSREQSEGQFPPD